MRPACAIVAKGIKSVSCATLRLCGKKNPSHETFPGRSFIPGSGRFLARPIEKRAGLAIAALQHNIDGTPMWRRLVTLMRFDRPNLKLRPLKPRPAPAVTGLAETAFDPNPGNLRLFQYLPPGLKPGAPLVVTLHGCGQTAGGYDLGTGWCQLADQLGFAVLA